MKQEIENMKSVVWSLVLLQIVCWCDCQNSTLFVDVVEIKKVDDAILVCNVSSAGNLSRWSYLSGPSGTSLLSFQNGTCTVTPPDSFLSEQRYSYSCNSSVYQVNMHYSNVTTRNNHILACQDARQPDGTGCTWIIKSNAASTDDCSYCQSRMKFNVLEVNEGMQITFVFRVSSSNVTYINWSKNIGSITVTASMAVQNGACTISPSSSFLDNTSEYIYTCNTTVYQVTKLHLNRSEHNDIFMCTPMPEGNEAGSNWILKVRASVLSVTLTPAKGTVDVKENAVLNITCTTSTARPAASVYWYIHPNGESNNISRITKNITTTIDYNDLSITTSILRFVPTQLHHNTKILCRANNTVNTSPINSNRKILLHVLYKAEKPYIVQGNNFSVIENEPWTLSCYVKGGNPTPILSWSCNKFSPTNQSTINSNGNTTTTLTWTALRNHDGTCTCTSQQTGFQNETNDISLEVLYPPSKPEFEVNGTNVTGDIKIVESKTRSIKCTADSKPSPDRYTWTSPTIVNPINSDTLIFNEIKKTDAGQYTCSVRNTMKPSSGGSVAGTNNTVVKVIVLHPPVVKPINNISILKGEQLNLTCNFTAGMPNDTSIEWKRNIDNRWNTTNLYIMSLKKNDTGKYTCTAFNTMIQSGDNTSYIGQHSQSFYLDVVYGANITSFTIDGFEGHNKTVNESDPVSFVCQADSNPTATMKLSNGSKILDSRTSNSLKYNLVNASCLEAGIYYCSAWNSYNDDNDVNATVQLFVNCYPRIQTVVDMNITSEKNETITLELIVIAYPPPTFTWYQLVDENWTLLNGVDNYVVYSSNVLSSNLTIHSVGMEDFTSYKVIVENDVGKMEQFYSLTQYDKPDPPSQFRHIEGYATTSSIHLEWKPGFDNGPSQIFYIKYKKSSNTKWNYLIVDDNGEENMELTLTELTDDTQYDIVIFASNEKGNSSESKVLVARTQAIDKPPPAGALIGGIAGGVAGCIILVIVIIVIIRRYPVFKRKGANEPGIRRSVSDDSDVDDGLVDNPMYVSSNNVASAVPSSSGVTATRQKPKQANSTSNEDLYTVVNKTKKQGKVQKGKTSTGKNAGKEVDVYENVELANKPAQNDGTKQSSQQNASTSVPKLMVVNKDGLIYADLVFNDKPPGEKMVINGDDPTPYALVDFTKKAEPLPESDNDDEK